MVVGGGGGLGGASARALAELGAFVTVADRNRAAGKHVVEEIKRAGGVAQFEQVDVADAESIAALFRAVDASLSPALDVLVNSSGVIHYRPLAELTLESLDQTIAVNVRGSYLLIAEAARRMMPRRHGAIVNLTSVSAFISPRTPAAGYAMSKAAIRQLTVAAAAELGPHGIRVNAVAPGTVRTDFVQGALDDPATVERIVSKLPLGRLGEPEDVVGAIVFLASTLAANITGHTLVVDGGRLTTAG